MLSRNRLYLEDFFSANSLPIRDLYESLLCVDNFLEFRLLVQPSYIRSYPFKKYFIVILLPKFLAICK